MSYVPATPEQVQAFEDEMNAAAPAPSAQSEVQAMRGQLREHVDQLRFILGGNAVFTVVNTDTGNRFTYKVQAPYEIGVLTPSSRLRFVKVLTGPDNRANYQYLGTIFFDVTQWNNHMQFKHTRGSRISESAQSYRVFAYIWKHLNAKTLPPQIEIWHEGRCGICGRALTVPESVERGIGPVCAGGN